MTAPALACRKCGAGDFNAHRAARAASRIGHPLAPLTPRHEGELFEQHHILLILEQRAVERRDRLADIAVLEHFERHVLGEQQLEPVDQLARRGLFLERSEEHTSELQSLMRISSAVFCLKKKNS